MGNHNDARSLSASDSVKKKASTANCFSARVSRSPLVETGSSYLVGDESTICHYLRYSLISATWYLVDAALNSANAVGFIKNSRKRTVISNTYNNTRSIIFCQVISDTYSYALYEK